MKARLTPWWYFAVSLLLGLLAGAALVEISEFWPMSLVGAPWIVPVVLLVLGAVVLVLALQVHQYVKGDRRELPPDQAVNTLILAKALGLAGALLAGWYGGQALMSLGRASSPYYRETVVQCAVSAGAALADLVIGIISERLCQLPPGKGPEHPEVKRAQMAGRRRAAAQGEESCTRPLLHNGRVRDGYTAERRDAVPAEPPACTRIMASCTMAATSRPSRA